MSLGRPIRSVAIAHAAYTTTQDGRHLIAGFVLGYPTVFSVVDSRTGELVFSQATAHHEAAWAVAQGANRHLYFGTANYDIFEFDPDTLAFTQIADKDTLGDFFVWRAATGPDGSLYVGTYPRGLVAVFDAERERTWRVLTELLDKNQYVHAIALRDDLVYVGASTALLRIYGLDPLSGETKRIIDLPAHDRDQSEFIYDIHTVGDHLFVHLSPQNELLVWDLVRGGWIARFAQVHGLSVIAGPAGTEDESRAYFYVGDDLVSFDADGQLSVVVAGFAADDRVLRGASWRNDGTDLHPNWTFVTMDTQSRIRTWNRASGEVQVMQSAMAEAQGIVRALGTGPGDELLVSGFMMPAYLTVATHSGLQRVDVAGQFDALGALGTRMLLGRYPDARLMSIDTTVPVIAGANPAAALHIENDQDRPIAMIAVSAETVAVATGPKGGRMGGAITMWTPETHTIDVHRDPVHDHKPLCFEFRAGILYFGTGVTGGYGTVPTAEDGLVCAYDIATRTVLWTIAPAPGEGHVCALQFLDNGDLAVLTTRSLSIIGGAEHARPIVLRSVELWPTISDDSLGVYMRGRSMVLVDDVLIATNQTQICVIDVDTLMHETFATGENVTLATGGDIYYSRGSELLHWSWEAPAAGARD